MIIDISFSPWFRCEGCYPEIKLFHFLVILVILGQLSRHLAVITQKGGGTRSTTIFWVKAPFTTLGQQGAEHVATFCFSFFYGNLSQKKIVFQYLCGCFLCLSSILDFRCTVGPLSSWMQLSLQLAQSGKHRLSRKWLIYASVICNLSRVEHSWTLGISLACMA